MLCSIGLVNSYFPTRISEYPILRVGHRMAAAVAEVNNMAVCVIILLHYFIYFIQTFKMLYDMNVTPDKHRPPVKTKLACNKVHFWLDCYSKTTHFFLSSAIFTTARNYWRRLIFLQFTTCNLEFMGMLWDGFRSRVCGGHKFRNPKERSITR